MSSSRNKLIHTLDGVFSKYIRARDSKGDYYECVTCFGLQHVNTMQCGHYQERGKMPTRWHEHNSHGQCFNCNNFEGGRKEEHGDAIDLLYGEGTQNQLDHLSRGEAHYTEFELRTLITVYRDKLKSLA